MFSIPLPASRIGALVLAAALSIGGGQAAAQPEPAPHLFRVVGPRDDVTIGLGAAEFDAIGPEPGVARLARRLAADGQVTAWRYTVTRAPDGTTRLAPAGRLAIMRQDTLRIEDYRAALPVLAPPSR